MDIDKTKDTIPNAEQVVKKGGRQKGSTGKNKITEGKIIELIQPTQVANAEEPTPISMTAARKLINATKKPRVVSEEAKKKMLANLEKGRQVRASMLKAANDEKQKEVEIAKKELVIKKYIVKPKQQHRKRKMEMSEPEETTEAIQTEDFTENETDMEIYKKIKRQERLLKKIKQVKENASVTKDYNPTKIRLPASAPVYSVFY